MYCCAQADEEEADQEEASGGGTASGALSPATGPQATDPSDTGPSHSEPLEAGEHHAEVRLQFVGCASIFATPISSTRNSDACLQPHGTCMLL